MTNLNITYHFCIFVWCKTFGMVEQSLGLQSSSKMIKVCNFALFNGKCKISLPSSFENVSFLDLFQVV